MNNPIHTSDWIVLGLLGVALYLTIWFFTGFIRDLRQNSIHYPRLHELSITAVVIAWVLFYYFTH